MVISIIPVSRTTCSGICGILDISTLTHKPKSGKESDMDIPSYHLNFVNEEYDENGILTKFEIKYPDNFNYAYDIIDKYGEMEPDRRALMWVDLQGNEKLLTYGDVERAVDIFQPKNI